MRYLALATDYDGTLACDGTVAEETWTAVQRLRDSGRKLILVTGRELDDLISICPTLDRFDRVVAENGGLLYRPATREHKVLGPPPTRKFIQALIDRKVLHLSVGHTIVATTAPYLATVVKTIRDLGLELQVILNKGAVMVLPPGVNKATGLQAALLERGLSPHNVVGVGDAENDHAFLALCECSAAVANALPMLKDHADIVTGADHGRGVMELIDELLANDLGSREEPLSRHCVLLGRGPGGDEVRLLPYGTVALVAGPSGSGKSTVTTGLLERLAWAGYQFCVIDPEGDYQDLEEAVTLGNTDHAPSADEVLQLLRRPDQNVVVNMLRVPLGDRPLFCAGLLPRLQELRAHTGRPHWLVFDEVHHLFPAERDSTAVSLPQHLETALMITVHPEMVSRAILRQVNTVLAVGSGAGDTLAAFARAARRAAPHGHLPQPERGQVLAWLRGNGRTSPVVVEVEPAQTQRRRHSRKYAEGALIPERSFYFRGPQGKLNLRAHNLILFLELAEGVDEDTWLFHFRKGDYSRWFRDGIGDKALAAEARKIEADKDLGAAEGRIRFRQIVEQYYTISDNPSLPKSSPPAGGGPVR
jgi:HAD superfamily hydrolase (TIGR01484 family)